MSFDGDLIEIRGLRAYGYHGVLDHEKRNGQVFVIDATLAVDHRRAGASDDLADTVSYAGVSEELAGAVEMTRFDLVEALAEHLAAQVLRHEAVTAVRIRVAKPFAPVPADVREVAVVVTRP